MDKWLRNNNVVKIIALLIGILLWVVVHLDDQSSSGATSPVQHNQTINNVTIAAPKFDSAAYTIVSIAPSTVNVVLRGKDAALRKVNTNTFQAELDLSQGFVGTKQVPVTLHGLPSTVTGDVFPAYVQVTMEEKQKKEVPVVVSLVGTPAAGFKAGTPIIRPNRVHVTVPTSRLDEVDSARAEISIEKAKSAVTKQVRLVAYSKDGHVIEGGIDPQLVDVEVPITAPFKTMPVQVKLIGHPAPGYSIASVRQSVEQVTVFGPQDVLDKMEFYDGVHIDVTDIKATQRFTVDIPLQDNLAQIDQTKMTVDVEVVQSATKDVDGISLTIVGQSDGYDTRLITANVVRATFEGAPALLDKLRPQDVQAFVDVSNLPPGSHELTVQFAAPTFVHPTASQPLIKATVDISAKTAAIKPDQTPTLGNRIT